MINDQFIFAQPLRHSSSVSSLSSSSIGFQLTHKVTCKGGGGLTRHSHDARVRLGGVTIWRLQCTTCKAVFTVLPHFVLRYRSLRPEVARDALLATHGGLSLERCAAIYHLSPMALYRLVCAFGQQSLVTVLTRCGLPLPRYVLVDEKHSRCLTDRVYLHHRQWPGDLASGLHRGRHAAAFTLSYGVFQRAASQQDPSYRVRGILTDGFDSTTSSMRALFPGARFGNCLRHAINKLPKQLAAIASPVRKALRSQFHTLLYRARQRKGLRVFALGQRLATLPTTSPTRRDGQRRARATLVSGQEGGLVCGARRPADARDQHTLDQAHNAIRRKLFAMKGFHHPGGSQPRFSRSSPTLHSHPYQRRAKHAGQCGVEVEGGRVPTQDWMLNLQILTSGGFR